MTERYVGAWPTTRPPGLRITEAIALGYTLRTRHYAFRRDVAKLATVNTEWAAYYRRRCPRSDQAWAFDSTRVFLSGRHPVGLS
jgi:hypothetical protein